MIKTGDMVFIFKNKNFYTNLDTNPNYVKRGMVESVKEKNSYTVRLTNSSTITVNKTENEIMTINDYIKRCKDVSKMLQIHAEIAEEF